MVTEMVLAIVFANLLGAGAALPFVAAQNLLSQSLRIPSRNAMDAACSPGDTNTSSPSKSVSRRQSTNSRRMSARQGAGGPPRRSLKQEDGGPTRSELIRDASRQREEPAHAALHRRARKLDS
jgi:hypothetical protein